VHTYEVRGKRGFEPTGWPIPGVYIYIGATRHAFFFIAALVEVQIGTSAHLLPCQGLSARSSISPEHISAHLWPVKDLCGSKSMMNGHLEVAAHGAPAGILHTSAHLRLLKYSQFDFQDVNKCALMRGKKSLKYRLLTPHSCALMRTHWHVLPFQVGSKRPRSTLQVRTCDFYKCALRCYTR
jgi:hypothetical protein